MTAHSPGPWRAGDDAVHDLNDNRVCSRPPAAHDDEWAADARLIADGPDLLHWLKVLHPLHPGAARCDVCALIARVEGT